MSFSDSEDEDTKPRTIVSDGDNRHTLTPPSSSNDDASCSDASASSDSVHSSHPDEVPFVPFGSSPNNAFDVGGSSDVPPFGHTVNIQEQKAELLYKLDRMQKRGVKIVRRVNEHSSYEEVSREYARITKDREVDASIRFQRMILTTCVTGIEFLNNRFDPLNIQLDGWSENVSDNLPEYDDVFEELHQKYKSKAAIAPELKLMMMIGGSAVQFHMTNTLFKSMPGLDQLVKQSPDLMDHITRAAQQAAQQAASGGGHSRPTHHPAAASGSNNGGSGGGQTSSSSMQGPKDMDEFIRNLDKTEQTAPAANTIVDDNDRRILQL